MSVFEIGMLVCFGAAWPVNIYKSVTSKSVEGKSGIFLIVVWVGYLLGILNKIFFNYDGVVWLYALNMLMVSVDMVLFYRNKKRATAGAV